MNRRKFAALAGAGLAAYALTAPTAHAATQPRRHTGLFGSLESRFSSLKPFPQWRGALARYFEEATLIDQPCRSEGRFSARHLQDWQEFLESIAEQDRAHQIDAVNREMNQRSYILDPINWGQKDYWASPGQFLQREDDCEDYAIAKYMSLRALGLPRRNMRVVVLKDLNLGIPHAILSLQFRRQLFILDNQISMVVPHTRIHHYRPIYSINEDFWWLHRYPN